VLLVFSYVKNYGNPPHKDAHQLRILYKGGCCSEYLATAAFVEQVHNLLDNFNGGKRFDQGKTLHFPLNDNSPHVEHWKKASMWINSWIFPQGQYTAFHYHPPSQNGWLVNITAAQHVWRAVKRRDLSTFTPET
jgi:hypothetical protein